MTNNTIILDERLLCVAKYVKGDVIVDIGCDHGKLCGYLLQQGKVKKAIGSDISPQSLVKSEKLKSKYGLDDFELRVADGLSIKEGELIDIATLCGVGSNLTIEIIKSSQNEFKKLKSFILCPLKNTFIVRKFLYDHGFVMDNEDLVYVQKRYYNVFVVKCGNMSGYDDVDVYVGRKLMGNPLLKPYLIERISRMKKNIEKYHNNFTKEAIDKLLNMETMLSAYEKGYEELCK